MTRWILLSRTRKSQQGVALYVVMIIMLLASLAAIWGARSTIINELLVSNEADYQRAFEAAQAMLQDAEMDIRGVNSDGSACTPNSQFADICRVSTVVRFDFEKKELHSVIATLTSATATGCIKGICHKRLGIQNFWDDSDLLLQMTQPDVGARFGQFTGAAVSEAGNPVLANRSTSTTDVKALRGAWYWVEILPYVNSEITLLGNSGDSTNSAAFSPSSAAPWVYRITALARGNKDGTEVVLQSLLSLKPSE